MTLRSLAFDNTFFLIERRSISWLVTVYRLLDLVFIGSEVCVLRTFRALDLTHPLTYFIKVFLLPIGVQYPAA